MAVEIISIERRGRWIVARARVASESDPSRRYLVVLERRAGSRRWEGWCECPDFRYRGEPCKHIVKAKAAVAAYIGAARRACRALAEALIGLVKEARGSAVSIKPGASPQAAAPLLERLAELGLLARRGRSAYVLSRGSPLWELAERGDVEGICRALGLVSI